MSNSVDTAVLELLAAGDVPVHDGHVADSDDELKVIAAELPYLVFYSTPGAPHPLRRLGSVPRARVVEFQISFVGETREQAKWAGQRADDALDGSVIQVAGRPRRIRRTDDNLFVRRDDTWTRPGGEPLFYGATRYAVPT